MLPNPDGRSSSLVPERRKKPELPLESGLLTFVKGSMGVLGVQGFLLPGDFSTHQMMIALVSSSGPGL